MKRRALVARGLTYYWRTHAAVVLGVATAVAVLAGALLVGDSVRGSLRDLVVERLGRADRLVFSTDFFREALAEDLRVDRSFGAAFADVSPLVVLQGLVTDQETGRRASRVQVYGVDDRFWRFHHVDRRGPNGRDALVNQTLAREIGSRDGSSVLVRVERPSAIPIESVHGRKDNLGRSLRLTVRGIVPPADMGDFSIVPSQGDVRAVFVPLQRLQQDLDVAGRVNALVVSDRDDATASTDALTAAIRQRFALEDVGLTVRAVGNGRAIAVESATGLLDASRATAVAASPGAAQPIFTYLANTIRSGDKQVPYSLITATDLQTIAPGTPSRDADTPPPIVLNDWTARELDAHPGSPITLEYYVWEDPGRLVTRTADFRVADVVPIDGAAADRDLAPIYPGITEAKRLGDWDPPFPIDLSRIRRVDEDYWDRYRTTPKAFIPIGVGQRLWSSRFGDRTSVRIAPAAGEPIEAARDTIASAIRAHVDPIAAGLSIRDVRADGLAASRGATDFGEYFTYFSFFLVVSALMLAALFFRLGVEQRAREVGLLRSVGYTQSRVRRLFSAEGFVLAAAGSAIGVAGAVAYAAAMMAGLRTWWSGAVGTTSLRLHVSAISLAAGAIGALAAAVICIWWTLRTLSRLSERSLLAGQIAAPASRAASRRPVYLAIACALVGSTLLALAFAAAIDRTGAFFGAGTSLLVACLFAVTYLLRRPPASVLAGHGWRPLWRVGLRNAGDRPGRSVLAIGVIASATFIVIAVEAFRRTAPPPTDRYSGTGGYSLLVDLLLPVVDDPNGANGREALGLAQVGGITVDAFRVLPGDDASCLNLYEPKNPRVVGVRAGFVDAGRFAFAGSLASTGAEHANPWLLLNRDLGADVVPVVADANSLTYVLHKSLGDEVIVAHGGRPVHLRIVAALADSIFQRELLMSDANFARLFPEQEGYRLLLVDTPAERAPAIATAIEDGAADLGADATSTAARLAEFHTVENTYLSTFQTLGGLGLLVGTLGLGAVVLRNVLERRRELALLGAVGYRRRHLFTIVLAENLLLLAWGLGIGVVCALIAIAPAVLERGGRLPVTLSTASLLVAVFVAGLVSSVVGTGAALRTPLVGALRSE
jgi:ABC-type lipoprotein release transport system permease subunit